MDVVKNDLGRIDDCEDKTNDREKRREVVMAAKTFSEYIKSKDKEENYRLQTRELMQL